VVVRSHRTIKGLYIAAGQPEGRRTGGGVDS
jgi:hypothetical protein